MGQEVNKYKNFAFISYSHKDIEEAKRLEQFLCDFRLPVHIKEKYPDRPEKFKEIFRDNSSMNACPDLNAEIKRHLDESEYLFIVCSPYSAQSPWVKSEIEYFKEKRGFKNIYPFVVSGVVNADERNTEQECIPEPLGRPYKGRAANISTYSFEHAIIEIIADIIQVDVDEIWQRHIRLEEERKQKLKEQNDKLLISQSRFLAEKANQLVDEGDSYLASILSLKALPTYINNPNRPYVLEAEMALRRSTQKEDAFLMGHNHSVVSSITSHDGSRFFSTSWDKKLCVWDTQSGRLIVSKQKHTKNINSVALNQDGSLLATASDDKKIILWDTRTIRPKGKSINFNSAVNHVSFSPCGKYILAALANDSVCVSDIEGNRIIIFDEKSDFDYKEAFHVLMINDFRIVTSSFDGVKLWKWDTKANIVKLHKYLENEDKGLKVQSVLYCQRINALLFAQNKGLYLYTLTDEKITRISFSSMITAIAIDKSENYIAVACYNYLYLQVIPKDGKSWGKTKLIAKFEHGISSLAFHPRQKSLLISFNTGSIRLIDLGENSRIQETTINADSLSFISNNRFVVASSLEYQPCVIYDLKKTIRETVIPDDVLLKNKTHYGISYDDFDEVLYYKKKILCLSKRKILSFSTVGNVSLKDNNCSISLSNYRCCFKTISANGEQAIYAYKDGTMFLVDVRSGKIIKMLERTKNHTLIHSACFSRDSKYIATTSEEGANRLYYAKDGSFIQILALPLPHWGNSIEFNKKGDMILCASQDYNIYIWKKDEKKERFYLNKTLAGHEERVCCASFSSDGKLLVSSSPNKVIVWDLESGIPVEVIKMKTKEHGLNFVKFSPDDTRIFASREGKLVIIEFSKLQKLITTMRERFKKRKLTSEEKKKYYLE